MADISVTAASVVAGSNAIKEIGTAGSTVTAGQALYLAAGNSTLNPANGNSTAATAECVGISLHAALANQPLQYITAGNLTLNAVLTAGKAYIVSGTAAGGICPIADLATSWRTSLLGIAASTTVLTIQRINSGVSNA
jgi:hypothetical protein